MIDTSEILAAVAIIVTIIWVATLYRLIKRDKEEREKLAAMRRRRALDAASDLQEDIAAQMAMIEMLHLRISDLQETNLQQQAKIATQQELIGVLSPYQAIPTRMPWGKN